MNALFSSSLRRCAAHPHSTSFSISSAHFQMRQFFPENIASLVLNTLNKKQKTPKACCAEDHYDRRIDRSSGDAQQREPNKESATLMMNVHDSMLSSPFSLPPPGTSVLGEDKALPPMPVGTRRSLRGEEMADVSQYPQYVCASCEKPLFSLCPAHCSPTSAVGCHQSGWPSFVRPIEVEAISISAKKALMFMNIEEKVSAEGRDERAWRHESDTNSSDDDGGDDKGEARGHSHKEDFRNRGEFRVDPRTASATVETTVQTASEIRRRHSRINYDKYGNTYEKRKMLDSVKVSKRLWMGNRGDGNHSNTVFVGQCAGCRDEICFVSMPAHRMPSFTVNARKVVCVPAPDST